MFDPEHFCKASTTMTSGELSIKIKKKAPISKKKCDNCLRTFNVPCSRQFCKDVTCEGILIRIEKEKKEAKKEAPRCDKHCSVCFKEYVQVPCATKKCQCGNTLSRLFQPTATGKYKNICGLYVYIDPID